MWRPIHESPAHGWVHREPFNTGLIINEVALKDQRSQCKCTLSYQVWFCRLTKQKRIYHWGWDNATAGNTLQQHLCKHPHWFLDTAVHPVLQAVRAANGAQPEGLVSYTEKQVECSPLHIQVSNLSRSLCNYTGKALYVGERSIKIQSGMALIWHSMAQHSLSNDTNSDRHFLPLTWFSHWQHLQQVAESVLLPPLLLAWFSPLQQSQPVA